MSAQLPAVSQWTSVQPDGLNLPLRVLPTVGRCLMMTVAKHDRSA